MSSPTADQVTAARPPVARTLIPRLVWRRYDGAPWLTIAVLVGLAVAAAFKVFGLPSFTTMAPLYSMGVVTPSCGITRSVTSILRGDFALAWRFNPAGFLLIGGAAGVLLRWLVGRVTGRWLGLVITDWRVVVAGVLLAVGALWVNQQANADFIINTSL